MHWSILKPNRDLVTRLKREFHTSTAIARVLANRGITSLDEARPFFHPQLDHLHAPLLMKDMETAVERNPEKYSPTATSPRLRRL